MSGASDLWILPDGRIYAHNLTPALARVLRTLNPEDETLRRRAASGEEVP